MQQHAFHKILGGGSVITTLLLLSACSSSYSESEIIEIAPSNTHVYERDLTTAWGHKGRGGAVIRQEAWVHVLSKKDPLNAFRSKGDDIQKGGLPLTGDAKRNAIALMQKSAAKAPPARDLSSFPTSSRAYSVYELSRWERYCSGGATMDLLDWEFVGKEKEIVPEIYDNCTPPLFSYQDYVDSWTQYCNDPQSIKQDKILTVVTSSPMPRSLRSACKKSKLSLSSPNKVNTIANPPSPVKSAQGAVSAPSKASSAPTAGSPPSAEKP